MLNVDRWWPTILLLLFSLTIPVVMGTTSDVLRLNMGVIFHHHGEISLTTGSYTTMIIQRLPRITLPDGTKVRCTREIMDPVLLELDDLIKYNGTLRNCGHARQRQYAKFVYDLIHDFHSRIQRYLDIIHDLLPNYRPTDGFKQKRSIIPIFGRLYHTLFGLVSESEMQTFTRLMNKAIKLTSDSSQNLQHEIDDLASTARITNQRIQLIIDGYHERQKKLEQIVVATNHSFLSLSAFTLHLLKIFDMYSVLEHELALFTQAVQKLSIGLIDPFILDPSHLTSILQEIQERLAANSSKFHLLADTHHLFYHLDNHYAVRHNDSIYLFIRIPVSSWVDTFELFQAQTLEIPMASTNHTTVVTDIIPWFAISKDRNWIIEFPTKPFIRFGILSVNDVIIKSTNYSCTVAILNDNSEDIREFCHTILIRDNSQPKMIRLNPQSALFIHIDQVQILTANGTAVTQAGCLFCVMQFACSIQLQSNGLILPALFTDCFNTDGIVIEIKHATNLHVLHALFSLAEIKELTSVLLNDPLEIVLPNLNFSQIDTPHLEVDAKLKMSLQKLAEKIKTGGQLFDSHQAALADLLSKQNQNDDSDDVYDWQDYCTIILFTLVSIFAGITLFLIYRVFKLNALVAVALTTHAVRGTYSLNSSIPQKLVYASLRETSSVRDPEQQLPKPLNATDFDFHVEFNRSSTLIQNVILFLILLTMVYVAWRRLRAKRQNMAYGCQLFLKITNEKDTNVTILWQELADDIEQYTFTALEFIEGALLKFSCRGGSLHVNWPALIIRHRESPKYIDFTSRKRVSFWQAYRIYKCFKGDYSIILYSVSGLGGPQKLIIHDPRSERVRHAHRRGSLEAEPKISDIYASPCPLQSDTHSYKKGAIATPESVAPLRASIYPDLSAE